MSKHLDKINAVLDGIGKQVLPIGHKVRTSTTLAAAPNDLYVIRHHAKSLRAEGYAEAMRDVIAMKQSEFEDEPEYVYVYDIESLAGSRGVDLDDVP